MFQDLVIRIMVGVVFLSEGTQKFLFPGALGGGRFAKLGLPYPSYLGYFVATLEILCALLIIAGIRVRAAVWPLFGVMAGALYLTKYPVLINEGVWRMAHETRADFCMVCGLAYLTHSYWRRGNNA
jgi:putative oxidoreductase